MIDVVILYDDGCPNLALAREAVAEALRVAGLHAHLRELERGSVPLEWRGFASPTVLVEGGDVAAGSSCGGTACRVYAGPDGRLSGAPPVAAIVAALHGSRALTRVAAGS